MSIGCANSCECFPHINREYNVVTLNHITCSRHGDTYSKLAGAAQPTLLPFSNINVRHCGRHESLTFNCGILIK